MTRGHRGRDRSLRRPVTLVESKVSEYIMDNPEISLSDTVPATTSNTVDLSRIQILAESVKDRLTLFHGGPDPWLACFWLESLIDTFEYTSCTEAEKVELAVYHLRDQAVIWWETMKTVFGERDLSWSSFREAFKMQYFSAAFCQERRQEFLSLKQGDRSVMDYHMEFLRLAEFCPYLVAQDSDRMFQFTQGLAAYIRQRMSDFTVHTYREAVDCALFIEMSPHQIERERDAEKSKGLSSQLSGQKRPAQGSRTRYSSRRRKGKQLAESTSESQWKKDKDKKCHRCGSHSHLVVDCPLDHSICYFCKLPGHIVRDCSLKAQLEPTDVTSSGGRPIQQ
ncbi:uncharacterized protein LOC141845840 [Curcuma longa]|uniref:uncharacterized protein LOC141845840 n=1 Tax=Curcuma longa TaxID=136217 RepID=UPI003D9DB5A9